MPAFDYDQLKPFVSLIVLRAADAAATGMKNADDALTALKTLQKRIEKITAISNAASKDDPSGFSTRAYSYSRLAQASWTRDTNFQDTQHHLVLVVGTATHVALHLTDPKLQTLVGADLAARGKPSQLVGFEAIPRETLGAAFLTGGPTRTLWLSGVHGRTPLKADAKLLSGPDLEYALDPFEDQSFWWTAARAKPVGLAKAVGASAGSSRVWMAPTDKIGDFEADTLALLERLNRTRHRAAQRYSILTEPTPKVDLTKLHTAYDLSLFPPQPGAYPNVDPKELETWEADALAASFEVLPPAAGGKSPDLTADVAFEGRHVGQLTVSLAVVPSGDRVAFNVAETPTTPSSPELTRLAKALKRGHEVNVRYASGFSISGRHVFPTELKRVPFVFKDTDFGGFKITQEKPTDLTLIGQQKSLFCWTYHRYPKGWLVCDDGSMEIADFIHVGDVKGQSVDITLIHVKASHSEEAGRRISVSAYEVVSAQAVKNLRWATKHGLVDGLGKRRAKRMVWKDGQPQTPKAFQAYMKALKAAPAFKVVVIQPSLRKAKADAATSKTDVLKVDQLKFLLASAQRTCQALGADFDVLCAP